VIVTFDVGDQVVEGVQLAAQRSASFARGLEPRSRSSVLGGLLDRDETGLLEYLQVPAEVAVGDLQGGLEVGEVGSRDAGEDGEDPQAHALVDVVVETVDRMGGHVDAVRFAV
jgi:hypothetical protein